MKEKSIVEIGICFIVLCLMLSSCGTGYKVTTINDTNRGFKIYRMKGNFLPNPEAVKPYGNIQIDADFYDGGGPKANYAGLVVICLVPNGLQIQEDSSLTITIDNTTTILSSNKPDYKVEEVEMQRKKYLLERAWFQATEDLICALGQAQTVEYSLKGKNKILKGILSKENIERFDSFCKEFVKE